MFKKKNLCNDSFFNDINGHCLDKYQKKVVTNNSDYLLVVAGAGSGKTLTIIAKVKYLIEVMGYKENEILCLSFTNETVNNLKEKMEYKVDILTFHKLSLNILKENKIKYYIASGDILSYVVNEFFMGLSNDNLYELFLTYFDNKKTYNEIINSNDYIQLKNNILSFIKIIKGNNISMKDLFLICKKTLSEKNKIFLIFAFSILNNYIIELNSTLKVDFDDMICYAKDLVLQFGIKKKYRYIIIDEYQDISMIRFNLIKEILNATRAKLMCVGDDYQSIYGFSGSNIQLFIDFFKYFPKANRIDIKYTYRNSYELIKTAFKFIIKNPYQLRKNIYATFLYKNPIVLVYYDNDYQEVYNNLLNYLYLEEEKNILVLGRYNDNLKEVINLNEKCLNIKYLTVHRSKGLECDNVILLKMENAYRGFPSKIKNNDVFALINNSDEEIMYSEERRLFYVALTRCRKKIYILVPRRNPSLFIEEIKSRCCELLLK